MFYAAWIEDLRLPVVDDVGWLCFHGHLVLLVAHNDQLGVLDLSAAVGVDGGRFWPPGQSHLECLGLKWSKLFTWEALCHWIRVRRFNNKAGGIVPSYFLPFIFTTFKIALFIN